MGKHSVNEAPTHWIKSRKFGHALGVVLLIAALYGGIYLASWLAGNIG